jgi:hypothetical protein
MLVYVCCVRKYLCATIASYGARDVDIAELCFHFAFPGFTQIPISMQTPLQLVWPPTARRIFRILILVLVQMMIL